jgi:lysophospholipase L1-like esterase
MLPPEMLLAYFGLRRPYRFERVIPALLAVILAIAVAVSAIWLWAIDELSMGPRAIYFFYLGVTVLLALGLVRWPKLASALLALVALDLFWGVGSYGSVASLLPPLKAEPLRFRWHALLQVVPLPSLRLVSSTGLAISHTSAATRGREPAPGDFDGHAIVAIYGGSTTYDIGVGEGDTWGDRLGDALGRDKYVVVNNGVPGYTTVEHVLQTSFYQDKFGLKPRCAVYYVGWNDLRNSHIPHLDQAYADFHLPSQVDSLRVRKVGGADVTPSPLLTVLARFASAQIDTVQYFADPHGPPGTGDDPAVLQLFERNVRTISAINRQRGIPTVWVGQLINPAAFTTDGSYGWLPLVRDRDVPAMLAHLNDLLMRTAADMHDTGIAIAPERFGAPDFVDNGHFNPQGGRRFAEAIAPTVREACR